MTSLRLENLCCRLGSREVLRGLTTAPIEAGTVTAVVGRNGVGKSTLLRCIAGFVPSASDRMQLGSVDLRPQSAAQRADLLRYLPQAAPEPLHLTVHEAIHVALNARRRHAAREADRRVEAVAAELELEPLLHRHLDELSGGQKQMVWLAQALIHQPSVLLLDEPLTALDPNYQHHVMKLLRRLATQRNITVLVVLHDLNMALRYADGALVLQDGRVLAQGPVMHTLTEDVLSRAFLVDARLIHCPKGTPLIVIDDLLTL